MEGSQRCRLVRSSFISSNKSFGPHPRSVQLTLRYARNTPYNRPRQQMKRERANVNVPLWPIRTENNIQRRGTRKKKTPLEVYARMYPTECDLSPKNTKKLSSLIYYLEQTSCKSKSKTRTKTFETQHSRGRRSCCSRP